MQCTVLAVLPVMLANTALPTVKSTALLFARSFSLQTQTDQKKTFHIISSPVFILLFIGKHSVIYFLATPSCFLPFLLFLLLV
jgi:hypothetical protein